MTELFQRDTPTISHHDILTSSDHISHKQALDKAHAKYIKYKNRLESAISPVEQDFIKSIGTLEGIAVGAGRKTLVHLQAGKFPVIY